MTRRDIVRAIFLATTAGGAVPLRADFASCMRIAVLNESLAKIPQFAITAIQTQLDRHFSMVWGRTAQLRLIAEGAEPETGEVICRVQDETDFPGLLGYHFRTQDGTPYLKVFAQTSAEYGRDVTAVLSHEIMETLGNPLAGCSLLNDLGDGTGMLYNLEVCDPVEQSYYTIDGVLVSDFIMPAFYLPFSQGPYDFLGVLTKPLSTAPGGCLGVRRISGLPSIFG